jgi:hypothetical protein
MDFDDGSKELVSIPVGAVTYRFVGTVDCDESVQEESEDIAISELKGVTVGDLEETCTELVWEILGPNVTVIYYDEDGNEVE